MARALRSTLPAFEKLGACPLPGAVAFYAGVGRSTIRTFNASGGSALEWAEIAVFCGGAAGEFACGFELQPDTIDPSTAQASAAKAQFIV